MERQEVGKIWKMQIWSNQTKKMLIFSPNYHHYIRFREHIVKWLQILNETTYILLSLSIKRQKTYLLLIINPQKMVHFVFNSTTLKFTEKTR